MKPVRSVANYGTFFGVKRYAPRLYQSVWFDGRKMNGLHINDAALFVRRSTADRYAVKFEGQVAEVLQTLRGRAVLDKVRVETEP